MIEQVVSSAGAAGQKYQQYGWRIEKEWNKVDKEEINK
jgi:hypothetical protein